MSLEMVSLVEYASLHAKYETSIFKSYNEGLTDMTKVIRPIIQYLGDKYLRT